MKSPSAILLISCSDRRGIVAAVTKFILENDGNIIDLEQYVDAAANAFFMRVEWSLDGFRAPRERITEAFAATARAFEMTSALFFSDERSRMAVFVTREPHCLFDILARVESREWDVDIPLIVSNREDLRPAAERFGIPFHVFPVTAANRAEQERRELELLRQHGVNLVVLARYMQVVGGEFITQFPNRIINIHHSFLPAFAGAKPYHAAYERGVKIIGATSHYVTEDLDEGPIIEQDIVRVSHRESVEELIRRGKDVEKIVLARAIAAHIEHRVLAYRNRTVVFA
jgi:formyltetrahydrofolate deformylase